MLRLCLRACVFPHRFAPQVFKFQVFVGLYRVRPCASVRVRVRSACCLLPVCGAVAADEKIQRLIAEAQNTASDPETAAAAASELTPDVQDVHCLCLQQPILLRGSQVGTCVCRVS